MKVLRPPFSTAYCWLLILVIKDLKKAALDCLHVLSLLLTHMVTSLRSSSLHRVLRNARSGSLAPYPSCHLTLQPEFPVLQWYVTSPTAGFLPVCRFPARSWARLHSSLCLKVESGQTFERLSCLSCSLAREPRPGTCLGCPSLPTGSGMFPMSWHPLWCT